MRCCHPVPFLQGVDVGVASPSHKVPSFTFSFLSVKRTAYEYVFETQERLREALNAAQWVFNSELSNLSGSPLFSP